MTTITKPSIVWVDDDMPIIGNLTRLLEKDYDFIKKTSIAEIFSAEGIKDIKAADLLILDLLIPAGGYLDVDFGQLSGLNIAKHLRDEYKLKQPFIALSGVAGKAIQEHFTKIDWSAASIEEEFGIQALIAKPIRSIALKKHIEEQLSKES